MSDPLISDAEFARAQKAVERGWVTQEQVEAAVVARDRDSGRSLLAILGLTPDRIRELEGPDSATATILQAGSAPHPAPPAEAAEAMKDPKKRVGRYVIVNHLKSGGMGMVFRGWDPGLRRWVALKFLKEIGDETARAYFKREAQLAAALDHPNIAKIYEVGEHEGAPFIAMQFVDGESLATAKKEMKLESKLAATQRIAEAVKFAHERKVIHRDLKPANVMLDKQGEVYVMDFGLAKETAVEGESLGGSGLVVGSPSYMAPEQAVGKADAQSDVYGIGAILYELITGRPPFTGETGTDIILQVASQEPVWPRKLSPDTPEDVQAIILHALEKDRTRRYADANQLIEDLEAYARKDPLPHARRPTFAYVLGKKIRKQPLLWTFAAAMVLAILGGGTFGTYSLFQRVKSDKKARQEAEDRAKAEERARAEAQERARVEREGRERIAAELADSYLVQAQTAADSGDAHSAFFLFAQANAIRESHSARANALAFRRKSPRLLLALEPADRGNGSMDVSPDGKHVLVNGRILETETGKPLALPPETLGESVRFATGRSLAAVNKGRLKLWDLTGLQPRLDLKLKNEGASALRVDSAGTYALVSEAGDTFVELVRLEEGAKPIGLALPPEVRGHIRCFAASADGRTILWSTETKVVVWAVSEKELLTVNISLEHPFSTNDFISALAVMLDGSTMLAGTNYGALWLADVKRSSSDPVRLRRHEDRVAGVGTHGDGRRFWSLVNRGALRTWDPATGRLIGRTELRHGEFNVRSHSGDGRFVLTEDRRRILRLWNMDAWDPPGERIDANGGTIRALELSPDGKTLAIGAGSDAISIRAIGPGNSFDLKNGGYVLALAFAPDGKSLFSVDQPGRVRRWTLASRSFEDVGTVEGTLVGTGTIFIGEKPEIVTDVRERARDWDLGVAELDDRFQSHDPPAVPRHAWDRRHGRLLSLEGPGLTVWDAWARKAATPGLIRIDGDRFAVSSSGEWIAASGEGERLRLIDLNTGETRLETAPIVVDKLAVSPDDRWIAVSGDLVQILSASDGRPHGREIGDRLKQNRVHGLAFTPDGRTLATGTEQGDVRLWDVETCRPIGRTMRAATVARMLFSPDGRKLYVGCTNGVVYAWDVSFLTDSIDPQSLLKEARAITGLRLNDLREPEPAPPSEWTESRRALEARQGSHD